MRATALLAAQDRSMRVRASVVILYGSTTTVGMERGKSARGSPSLPAGFYLVEKTPGAGVVMNQFHYVGTRHPEKKPGRTARGRRPSSAPWIAQWGSDARCGGRSRPPPPCSYIGAAPLRCREEKVRWLDRCPATGRFEPTEPAVPDGASCWRQPQSASDRISA